MTVNTTSTFYLRSILEKEKLFGNNFLDWYRNLIIVLTQEKKLYVLEQPLPVLPHENATRDKRDTYRKHQDDAVNIGCLMLATMGSELQKQHENMGAYDMIAKLIEGSPVGPHVLKMIGYMETLGRLRFPLGQELATDLILQSLPDSYSQFVMNYNMRDYNKLLLELLSILRTCE
ncbi:hypothetical protein CRG98_031026 [Punica granatum]|uniref:Retrotransposon Copia-like N-terminal domain-containing protein n=1 Tax=Punica granatum TaxID=22663 RepID=A0A2I0IX79_PUNGR|nr:hypothetical protein CRG98_031026 [Punica granatum]